MMVGCYVGTKSETKRQRLFYDWSVKVVSAGRSALSLLITNASSGIFKHGHLQYNPLRSNR